MNNTSNIKNRNSSVEKLRIVSMLLIIAFHMARQINIDYSSSRYCLFFRELFGSWGILGSNIFLLISIWYSVEKPKNSKKIIAVLLHTFVYIFIFSIVGVIINFIEGANIIDAIYGYINNCVIDLKKYCFCSYWFVKAYVALLIVAPFLNKTLVLLNKKNLKLILIIYFFVSLLLQNQMNFVVDFVSFVYLYLLIGYWKKYGCRLFDNSSFLLAFAISFVIFCSRLLLDCSFINYQLSTNTLCILSNTFGCISRHSVIMKLNALVILFSTLNKRPKYSKAVNNLAKSTFGVYLFHENKSAHLDNILDCFMRVLNKNNFFTTSLLFPIEYLLIVFAIFLVGCTVEKTLNYFVITPTLNLIYKNNSNFHNNTDIHI